MTIVDAARPVAGSGNTHPDLHAAPCLVTGGVDTHLDLNVAAALDPVGGLLAVAEFPATPAGHRDLLGRLSGFRPVARGGGEGTGPYRPGPARVPRAAGLRRATGGGGDPVIAATKTALRILGRRVLALDEEKAHIDALLAGLVTQTAPQLLSLHGVGIDTAAALLVTAGDNPGRLRSEAAWAHLCGTAPIPASSGKATRYRLNRGGDRQANRALWGTVITRLRTDPRTQAYMAGRLAEGRRRARPDRRGTARRQDLFDDLQASAPGAPGD